MKSRKRRIHLLVGCMLILVGQATAQEEDPSRYPVKPKIAAASDEAELALTTFKYPAGWQAELWAAEPMLANPVVFSIDAQGKIWVCESYRQEKGVTDNRGHDQKWLDRDLAAQTVQDRIDYHKELLPDEGLSYTKHDDLIRVLEDSNQDGKADKSWVFADRFNQLEMGTGAGVLVNGRNVYYTCIPHLWLLQDKDGDGKSEVRQSLSSGYGVRVAFRGHDSHGLIMGPDGRVYFSIGDRGYSIDLGGGRRLHDPASGAVFRCEPDGSNLEVYATGLRNPQELAFDDYGNLFTGDNNSDSGDKARWVYVAQAGDSGWRMHYQYMPDRGPFNREKIWHPYHPEQPAFIVPPVTNISDGPSGLAYYPGTGLSEEYRGRFFLCDFRGASAVSGIRTFRSEPKGAFFELKDDEQPIWQILATDLAFGPDGNIYISDWINGWQGVDKGRIYRFSDPQYVSKPIVQEVKTLLGNGLADANPSRLVELLSHADQRVRQLAQFELVERKLVDELDSVLNNGPSTLARIHAMWAIGQLIRKAPTEELTSKIVSRLSDNEAEIRAQAAKLIGDLKIETAASQLIGLLDDPAPRVCYFAAIGLRHLETADAKLALLNLLMVNDGSDPALRHAALVGLAGALQPKLEDPQQKLLEGPLDLVEFARHSKSVEVRRGIAVVFRKQSNPRVQEMLAFEKDSTVLDEVARTIYDVPVLPAMEMLAKQLDSLPTESPHFIRRALGAANYLGGPQNAQRIANFAASNRHSIAMRKEALAMLAQWARPSNRDRVIGAWRELEPRPAEEATKVLLPIFDQLVASDEVRDAGVAAAKSLNMKSAEDSLQRLFMNSSSNEQTRMNVLLALSELNAANLSELCRVAAKDPSATLRMAAREVSVAKKFDVIQNLEFWNKGLASSDLRERQHLYQILASANLLGDTQILKVVERQLERLVSGDVPETERLDLTDTASVWAGKGKVDQLLSQYVASFDQDDPVSKNRDSLVGGDAEKGSEIFWNRASVYCQRCHQIGDGGGAVGPNLSDIALSKDRSYLLESIVNPNKTIAENFETTIILDLAGNTISGIVQKETDVFVQLIDAEAKVHTIQKDEIEGRKKGQSAMPVDLVDHLSGKDIRDLVEFLANQKTAPQKGVVIPEGHK